VTEARPWLVVLGGINGAGKSTLAESLAEDPSLAGAVFLNPDRATSKIRAADLSKSQRAAEFGGLRAVSQEIEQLLKARKSFVTETVFANEAYLRLLQRAKRHGYATRLIFVGVSTIQDAIERVAARVKKGGHDVREADIRRRWPIAHANLARAVPIVDEILVFSNSGYGLDPKIVAVTKKGEVTILDPSALPDVTVTLVPLVAP
jgi:predicted ABC-type ATPase